ncbi:MAG: 4Fe-4S binding protein [Bacteroidales bacterium]|jgi:uncharacterized protein with FMN-binding domain|nr:4Fe-4S binding protein [Bacteroidales bacterium]
MKQKIPVKRIASILTLIILGMLIAHRSAHQAKHEKIEPHNVATTEKIISSDQSILETKPSRHTGYAAETPLKIVLSPDQKIVSVNFLPNYETLGFIRRIENSGFMNSWNGLTLCEAIHKKVDALSGATMTTQCVINTLRDDLLKRIDAGEFECDKQFLSASAGLYYYIKTIASLLVLCLALFSFFFPKKMNAFRLYLLAFSVIVFGFWQGQYLSVTHFFNMLSFGINWTVWIIPLLVLLAFALPLITKKSFYCTYVCPFGAAQELVSKLNKKHIQIPQHIYKILVYLRPLYLLVIVGLLLFNVLSDFVDFEPFAAFMLDVNLWIPIVIAGVFLLVSIFSPKFWCKYCCPTGYVIELTR